MYQRARSFFRKASQYVEQEVDNASMARCTNLPETRAVSSAPVEQQPFVRVRTELILFTVFSLFRLFRSFDDP